MDLREYMSVRRAYNLVRQGTPAKKRLTFEEFAILCRLDIAGRPVKTSDIVRYQGALRPTMTHRTNHLARLGYINRGTGVQDHRNVVWTISDGGHDCVAALCNRICVSISSGQVLSRTSPERVRRYIDAMGSLYVTASDLVLLGLYLREPSPGTVTTLVHDLGLLQPTVSMSVRSLVEDGCLVRTSAEGSSRTTGIELTDLGKREAAQLSILVNQIVVRRRIQLTAL